MEPSRYWGTDRAILDDEAARERLIDAAGRCIVARGNTQFRMAEVAEAAGVARSTVYRYFPSRDDLLLALVLLRIDRALGDLVGALPHPEHAAQSIPPLALIPAESVDGNPLNEALFARESTALTPVLEVGAVPIVEVVDRHFGPLFDRWQADGQVHGDLDRHEILQWIQATTRFLLAPAWRNRSPADKRRFVDQYLVRALVTRVGQ